LRSGRDIPWPPASAPARCRAGQQQAPRAFPGGGERPGICWLWRQLTRCGRSRSSWSGAPSRPTGCGRSAGPPGWSAVCQRAGWGRLGFGWGRGAEPTYRVRAFRRAARVVGGLPAGELEQRVREGTLEELPGIGKVTAEVITEATAGQQPVYLARLLAEAPAP